jgi:hypothetical protein
VKKHLTFILILCLTCSYGIAQSVNGFWKGTLTMTSGCFPVNNIELQISLTGNEMNGASYHYLDINYYVKKNFRGTYNSDQKRLFIREGAVTTFKIPEHCKVCIKNYDLEYSRSGNVETLTGTWNGKIMGTGSDCDVGTITLSRIKESAFKEIPEIEVDTGDIKLDFYDNGVVDGDSITVLVNKVPVLVNQKLGGKPITTVIRVDLNNTFQEVEMVAENLGTIPPNTAILIITAGTKRYRLFMTSTEQKSAKVRFVYSRSDIISQADF